MRKTPLESLRRWFADRFNAARRLNEWVQDDESAREFRRAYEKATPEEAQEIVSVLDNEPLNQATYDRVRAWADRILKRDRSLSEYDHRELEELCKRHQVVGWSRMGNATMIDELRKRGVSGH